MANFGKGFSLGIGGCLSYFSQAAENRSNHKFIGNSREELEIDELKLQLDKIKVFYRCSRVKLIDLRQEIRLLNSLLTDEQEIFYVRRLDKFMKAHETTEVEVGKYKGQIDQIESRIEELKTPKFLRNGIGTSVQNTSNNTEDLLT